MLDEQFAPPLTGRRGFLARAAAMSSVLAGVARPTSQQGGDWMASLTAKHRTAFDIATHRDGKPLSQARNVLDAWRDAFHVADREVNLILCVHGEGIPIVLTDALWDRFKIADQYGVAPALEPRPVKNVFLSANAASAGLVAANETVEVLQRRGVRVVVCMNTIASATKKLSAAGFGTPDVVREAILKGIAPEVIIVPAMLVALTQLQEKGIAYIKAA
jgi:intracellular sulfur oxidation DsrE/DsrF family protein